MVMCHPPAPLSTKTLWSYSYPEGHWLLLEISWQWANLKWLKGAVQINTRGQEGIYCHVQPCTVSQLPYSEESSLVTAGGEILGIHGPTNWHGRIKPTFLLDRHVLPDYFLALLLEDNNITRTWSHSVHKVQRAPQAKRVTRVWGLQHQEIINKFSEQ